MPNTDSINRRHALCCGAAAVGGLFTSLLDPAQAPRRPPLPAAAQDLVEQSLSGLDGSAAPVRGPFGTVL
jgi:hypothetical protein